MKLFRIVAALSLVLACSVEPSTSHVRLHLTDAPGPEVESALVWISGAFLVPGDEGGPVVVTDEPQEFDLLLLQDGVTALLGDATVPASRSPLAAVTSYGDPGTSGAGLSTKPSALVRRAQACAGGSGVVARPQTNWRWRPRWCLR